MAKKLNYDDIKYMIEKSGSKLSSCNYVNSKEKLRIKCSCGIEFEKTFKVMNRSKKFKCNDCIRKELNENLMLDFEEVKHRLNEKGLTILNDESLYNGVNCKYKYRCNKGHVFESLLKDIFNNGCKICSYAKLGINQTIKYDDIVELYSECDYTVITSECEYYNNKLSYIIAKCNNGHIHKSYIQNFKNGNRCSICYRENMNEKFIIPFKDRQEYVNTFGYKIITKENDYINGEQNIIIMCDNNHIYETTINNFKNGSRCPHCQMSKGERKTKSILDKYNIDNIYQHKFDDCRNTRPLPFDFYLPKYNILIEYDGEQHYKLSFGDTIDDFIKRKINDGLKNEHCYFNNIHLIRIPYWDFNNIEQILIKELNLKLRRKGNKK